MKPKHWKAVRYTIMGITASGVLSLYTGLCGMSYCQSAATDLSKITGEHYWDHEWQMSSFLLGRGGCQLLTRRGWRALEYVRHRPRPVLERTRTIQWQTTNLSDTTFSTPSTESSSQN